MPKGTETAATPLRSPAIKEEAFFASRKRFGMPFAWRMRDHDDGDSRGKGGYLILCLCRTADALQLLGLYDARGAHIYVQNGAAKKRN